MRLRFFRPFHRGFNAAEPLHLPRVGQRTDPTAVTVRLAIISETHNLPHIHSHAFRHTAASTMIANGIDLVTTAHELGHANATTTATIYAHSFAVAQAKAAQA